ncbi:MAG: leucyl aminopeptidase family protein, partial [Alphaproteobacteria bacterium]|nr:leucyl aminopeptidase family protein [Alphaproteobacteria bacterium]
DHCLYLKIETVVGHELLENNFPMIHAVGRAAAPGREPRLIKMQWGKAKAPKIALVGKGVCFDTGGLDIKASNFMLLMKKDMGGAANILALAQIIMELGLDLNLSVYLPSVENSVSSDSFRPMDILTARDGTTVEIGNTDAEGRLILADAIVHACEDEPDIIIDMATLTGAARVALGTDLPALFSNDQEVAQNILEAGIADDDPLWQLPLHKQYRKLLETDTADISSTGSGGYAGSITAALFLEHFVSGNASWCHVDLMAWNVSGKAAKPKGGEAQAIRALLRYLETKYQ